VVLSPASCVPWPLTRDDIWSFSPFIDQSIFRLIRRNLPRPRLFDWQVMFFCTVVGLRFVQTELARYFPHSATSLESPDNFGCGVQSTPLGDCHPGLSSRFLTAYASRSSWEEQERLLLHARMEALQNQINPHFSFQYSEFDFLLWCALIPTPRAEVISKLAPSCGVYSTTRESFVPLREEVEFIDNYLDIEWCGLETISSAW